MRLLRDARGQYSEQPGPTTVQRYRRSYTASIDSVTRRASTQLHGEHRALWSTPRYVDWTPTSIEDVALAASIDFDACAYGLETEVLGWWARGVNASGDGDRSAHRDDTDSTCPESTDRAVITADTRGSSRRRAGACVGAGTTDDCQEQQLSTSPSSASFASTGRPRRIEKD